MYSSELAYQQMLDEEAEAMVEQEYRYHKAEERKRTALNEDYMEDWDG